jgi:hypothetical protein
VAGAISRRSWVLAERFRQLSGELVAVVEGCSDAQWRTICPGERQSVGVTARHVAQWYPTELEQISAIAGGRPFPPLSQEVVDEMNARHAAEHAGCTRDDVLALLRSNAAVVADTIGSFTDAELDRSGTLVGASPRGPEIRGSVQEFIVWTLISHTRSHLRNIRAAAGI